MSKKFINLHNHTIGSLLDGASHPEKYVERAIELGQPAVCATDHGNLYTLIDMYRAAQSAGIPFIPGEEIYMARKTRFDRDPEELSGRATDEWSQRGPYHQTILAVNNVGLKNLMKISSRAYTEGFFRKPRADYELISEHSEGIVCFSGCLNGPLQQALLLGDYEGALEHATKMQDIVGRDNYFIEIMNHNIPEELSVHNDLQKIAKKINAPIAATLDSHYTYKEDAYHHDCMLATNTGATLHQPDRFKFYNDSFYLKSYDEMVETFPQEWVDNTMLVYDKLDIQIDFDTKHYPVYEIPESSPITVVSDYFIDEIAKGAARRFGDDWKTERRDVAERLNYEIDVIQSMGYSSYFLMIADIIKWCRDNGVLVGPGRGSAASSLVAYCLRITQVDPLKFDLLFERFLTPGRVPDIDVDVDDRHRGRVLQHIRDTYGHDKTAQIVTISKLKAKSAIKDVCRVMGKPFDYGQKIVDAMPPSQYGVTKTLQECMQADDFRALYDADKEAQHIIDTAIKLEGVWRSDGVHAGGIIVADAPITDYCPVQQKGEGEPIVTQWDMRTVEDVGLLKIDMLGLKNLGVIEDTVRRVNLNHNVGINIENIYDLAEDPDPAVLEYISRGNTAQVFQMGSSGLTSLARSMGIDSIDDIVAVLALYRPGPMGSGAHNTYVKRKHGHQKTEPMHPLLTEILEGTHQLLLYQESIMQVGKQIAGFDPVASNKFLKSIGKKDSEIMKATRSSFVAGCVEHSGVKKEDAEHLFDVIEPHCDYSFNKSHSVSYSYITYLTAYFSYYYPSEYGASLLTSVMFHDEKKFRPVLSDIRDKIGLDVLPPSVNHSKYEFNVVNDQIVFSISGMKGIGEAKSKPFVNYRDENQHEYIDIYDFFRNANTEVLDKTFLEALIYSGGLDELVPDELVQDLEVDVESHLDLLMYEIGILGMAVTENAFDVYKEFVEFESETYPISEILNVQDSKFVRYCGIVKDPSINVSKAGRRYAKFFLDDGQDSLECLILGKSVKRVEEDTGQALEDILQIGTLLTFNGFLNRKEIDDSEDEEVSIYVNQIHEIFTPSVLGDRLNSINVLLKDMSRVQDMEKELAQMPGTHKVYLCFKHPDANLILKQESRYRVNDLALEWLEQFRMEISS